MPFAGEQPRHGNAASRGLRDGRLTDRPKLRGDLVGEHLLQAQAEQVRRVAAVGARGDVAAEPRGAARPSVARGAAVGKPRADCQIDVDVAGAVARHRPLSLEPRELPLKQLPAPADGAERVVGDDVARRVRIAAPRAVANLAGIPADERPGNAFVGGVGRLVPVDQLACQPGRRRQREHGEAHTRIGLIGISLAELRFNQIRQNAEVFREQLSRGSLRGRS